MFDDISINTNTQFSQSFLNGYTNIFWWMTVDYNKDWCDDIIALWYATWSSVYTNNCSWWFLSTSLTPSWWFDGWIKGDFNNDW
jgi:hypothetical protein